MVYLRKSNTTSNSTGERRNVAAKQALAEFGIAQPARMLIEWRRVGGGGLGARLGGAHGLDNG